MWEDGGQLGGSWDSMWEAAKFAVLCCSTLRCAVMLPHIQLALPAQTILSAGAGCSQLLSTPILLPLLCLLLLRLLAAPFAACPGCW